MLAGAYLFGAVTIGQLHAQALGFGIPSQLLSSLPYLATIVVLVLISRNRRLTMMNTPASLGRAVRARPIGLGNRHCKRSDMTSGNSIQRGRIEMKKTILGLAAAVAAARSPCRLSAQDKIKACFIYVGSKIGDCGWT